MNEGIPRAPKTLQIIEGVIIDAERVPVYQEAAKRASDSYGNPNLYEVITSSADPENRVTVRLLGEWSSRRFLDANEFWDAMRSLDEIS